MALIDDVTIKVIAGNGGRGGHSFHQNYGTMNKIGDGGDGGRGGSIYFEGTSNLNDLSDFRYKKVIEADDGERGMHKNLDGRGATDITVLVPLGTTIIDTATENAVEILEENQPVLIAKGGMGQSGNHGNNITPDPGDDMPASQIGEEKELHLILNLIADIGLIGLPNAGKSSLLARLTRANPKVGNYPFTTLEPSLGTISTKNGNIVLADIPGLIEGASIGRGLGIQFLKHIQKTKILFHCIDAMESNPYEKYNIVRNEFREYDAKILEKDEIILLTKIDLIEASQKEKILKELKKTKREIIPVSIYDEKSIDALSEKIVKKIKSR